MGKLSFGALLDELHTNTIAIADLSAQRLTKKQIAKLAKALSNNNSVIHIDKNSFSHCVDNQGAQQCNL